MSKENIPGKPEGIPQRDFPNKPRNPIPHKPRPNPYPGKPIEIK